MQAIIFLAFLVLAGVMLAQKFGPPRPGAGPEHELIRQGVWRALKIITLLLIGVVQALIALVILFFMFGGRSGLPVC
jgi:hypothetical protein